MRGHMPGRQAVQVPPPAVQVTEAALIDGSNRQGCGRRPHCPVDVLVIENLGPLSAAYT